MNPTTRRNARLATTLLLLMPALAGCTGIFSAQGDCATQPREPGAGDRPFEGWQLKVLTHGAWSATYEAVRDGFANRTGATLQEIAAEDAGGALQEAVLNKGNPVADVIWGIDNALFHRARSEGIFHPYTSPNTHRILDVVDTQQFKDEDGAFVATPADFGFISVNYAISLRERHDESELPKTLADLATPRWASTFVTQDPRTSSPGLGFLIATVATFGTDGDYTYKDYWRDLFANGVLITPGWTEAYVIHYSANGFGSPDAELDKDIVTSYTTSPAAEVHFQSFEEVNAVSLEPPNGVFHQIETVGILACSRHVELAKAFVDYVLTQEFQTTIPDTQAIYPVVEGVSMPPAYQEHATEPQDLHPAPFTAQELGANLDGWVAEWERLFQEHHA